MFEAQNDESGLRVCEWMILRCHGRCWELLSCFYCFIAHISGASPQTKVPLNLPLTVYVDLFSSLLHVCAQFV